MSTRKYLSEYEKLLKKRKIEKQNNLEENEKMTKQKAPFKIFA